MMKLKQNAANGSRQLNLLQQSYQSTKRSDTSKSPLHGFRARQYRLTYGPKVIFKRNVSVTHVPDG